MINRTVRLDDLQSVLGSDHECFLSSAPSKTAMVLTDVFLDSREVSAGSIFIALPGAELNGADFVEDAIQRGAVVVIAARDVCQRLSASHKNVTFISVKNPRALVGVIADLFYPEKPQTLVAVTGTNGKSSVVDFIRQLWTLLGIKAASLGTIGTLFEGERISYGLTTMDALALRKEFALLIKKGVTHVAMEASSHGLDQQRLCGIEVDISAFTNISHEHLDYHKTFENYLDAKLMLFKKHTKKQGYAVLNADCAQIKAIKAACGQQRIVLFGRNGQDLCIEKIEFVDDQQRLFVRFFGKHYQIELPLMGWFQGYNVVCAMGVIVAGFSPDERHEKLETLIKLAKHLKPVPGRLEKAGSYNGANIYVDFAHTPDSLEAVLKAVRHQTDQRVCVVFGCGGNRDSTKRKLMGEIAENAADYVIITEDNPRFEDPEKIRKAIKRYCPKAHEIGDRHLAIRQAIMDLNPGDVLVIAGKGHETGQIRGNQVLPFSDVIAVQSVLEEVNK